MEVMAEFALGNDAVADHTPPPTLTEVVAAATSPSRAAAYDHAVGLLLLRRTAQQAPRTTTTSRRKKQKTAAGAGWRCRVCQVECVGKDGLREHCMSDEHYHGLQLFALRPDLFPDPIDLWP